MGASTRRFWPANPVRSKYSVWTLDLDNGGCLQVVAYDAQTARRIGSHILRKFPKQPKIISVAWKKSANT